MLMSLPIYLSLFLSFSPILRILLLLQPSQHKDFRYNFTQTQAQLQQQLQQQQQQKMLRFLKNR